MRPDQRTAVAGEFVREFRLSGNPDAQRFTGELSDDVAPETVTEMHEFARQHMPDALARVMAHPVSRVAFIHAGQALRPEKPMKEWLGEVPDEVSPALERAEQAEDVIGALDPGSMAKRNPDEPDEFNIFLHR
jgi:hypothetical protein